MGIVFAYIGAFVRWLFLRNKKSFKELLVHEEFNDDPVDIMSSELVNIVVGIITVAVIVLLLDWLFLGKAY